VAAYEVLLLNTAIPQIQAAQSGDTYVVPRDIAINATAIISANSATDALRITQTGAGNAILVEDSANPDSTPFVVTAAGDVGIGTSSPSDLLHLNRNTTTATVQRITNTGGTALIGVENADGTGIISGAGAYDTVIRTASGTGVSFGIGYSPPAMRLNPSGNLGLGVAPSAWGSAYKAVQLFFGFGPFASNAGATGLSGNCFNNGTNWVYSSSNPATRYELGPDGGNHRWYTAPSGTANSTTIVSGNEYTIVTAGGNFTAFGAANNNVGTVFTATSSGTATGGAATQSIVFSQAMTLSSDGTFRVKGAGTAGTTDAVQFSGSAPASAMTLDASGNLGIGITNPAVRLAVNGAARVGANVVGQYVEFSHDTANGLLSTNTGALGYSAPSYHYWSIGGTERARITSGGDFCFNTTATTIATITQNALVARITNGSLLVHHENGNSGSDFAGFGYNGSTIGTISQSSTTTVAYNTSSDYRLKNNPQPLTGSGAFIDALQPKIWNWKTDGSKGVGFIAHEVQAVSPGSVTGVKDAVDEDGKPIIQMMEYGSAEFIANIVAELQSLRARVAQLEQGA
jgi:hypothetical protein